MKKSTLILIILLSLLLTTPVFAWTAPTAVPPNSDVSAPLNVSTSPQTKFGGLTVGSVGSGLLWAVNKFFVGTSDPTHPSSNLSTLADYVAEFNGNVGAKKYCDDTGANCKTILELASGSGGSTGSGAGVYVGATTNSYNGSQGGYAAVNAYCSAQYSGSRVCEASDFANGLPTVQGWYNAHYVGGGQPNDCSGWTSAGSGDGAAIWSLNSGSRPAGAGCNTSNKFLCCTPGTTGGSTSTTGGGGGVYVGATSGTYSGSEVGGYAGGDAKCNAAFSGSRMATAADFANGRPDTKGWYSSYLQHDVGANYNTDCVDWTVGLSSSSGSVYDPSSGNPSSKFVWEGCNIKNKILCAKAGVAGGGSTSGGGGATYIGTTPGTYNGLEVGNGNGYAGADARCNTAFSGSRMCTASDFANGLPPSTGNAWFNSFTSDRSGGSLGYDCRGWTSADGVTDNGSVWANPAVPGNNGYGTQATCNIKNPILCCKPGSSSSGGGSSSSGEVMYLRAISYSGVSTPANCPSGWTQADLQTESSGSDTTGFGYSNRVRTCYTDSVCRVMYLRALSYSGVDPASCPSGWTQADLQTESSGSNTTGFGFSNRVRTCYKCN